MINRLQRLINIPSSVWFKNLVWLPICSVPLDWCSNQGLVCKQQDRDHFKKEGCGVFQSDSVWCDWDVKAKHRLLWQRCHFGMNSKDKLETFCWTWEQSIRTENRKQLKVTIFFSFVWAKWWTTSVKVTKVLFWWILLCVWKTAS